MTSITRNLPWFVRDLGISIVGGKCYVSLVENLAFDDVDCLKLALSKGLGLGIVAGSCIMKVPQILLIARKHSARGISPSGTAFETLAYAINLTYSYRNQLPFSTYGENAFLTAQNIIIMLLIMRYAPRPHALISKGSDSRTTKLLSTFMVMAVCGVILLAVPPPILATFQALTLPISVVSKVPQIMENLRNRSTGQLSAFAVMLQVGGCAARVFTITQEVDDVLVALGALVALVLNAVIAAQMWMYWGQDPVAPPKIKVEEKLEPVLARSSEKPIIDRTPPHSISRAGTPSISRPGTPSSRSGRNWSRKSVYDVV
ncbi:mannose-P-dolichol utilization defect 1 protein [Schizophyllum amplum]|uniref:Mannose-P-dolichol utilization defect 1 protein n=1 Tax=Schizophyllum amplum TaxID=97359 RepID=A0A550BYH2_9AGAR|nr:mannose-P-dolichol utilization defect 1 protein [Auriculariopsis ampla]